MSMNPDLQRNYFELFDLPVSFDLDTAELATRYRELARRVHPDRFAAATAHERRLSMQLTTQVNEAYQTLRDPVRRARYLLGLHGIDSGADTDTAMDPAFLAEQMELREELEELRHLPNAQTRLAELANDIDARLQAKIDEFRARARGGVAAGARESLREMQFLDKLRHEVESLEEELA